MTLDKNARILFLVESPEKAKVITKIFKDADYKNIIVQATIGHFTRIKDGAGYYNTGIYPEQNFKCDREIDLKKLDNVKKLREQVQAADMVLLATDPDREGSAIAQTCVEFLKIPKNKYKRVTYQAVNRKAIFEAIDNAQELDWNLVDAATSRSFLDKGLGYRLSTLSQQQGLGKSVGRVQSAALRMICDREREILSFVPEKYYDLYLKFLKNNVEFKAKYQGTDATPIKRLTSIEQADEIFKQCEGHDFIVQSIEKRERKENPKSPFSTATFQQECANKLGLTVKQSADCAQKLFDAGKISYHRVDTEFFSEEFCNILQTYVKTAYPKKYVSGTVVKGKKQEGAQEAHESIHPLDLNLTPQKFAEENNNDLLIKVYAIIYNRTIAAALAPVVIAQTTYNIYNQQHKFVLNSNELRFNGYRCVYTYKEDDADKEVVVKETFEEGEVLKKCSFDCVPMETKPPARYKEASFVKEMKTVGIGRPSTYASTIETIKSADRGYCVVEDKCLKPTDLGMKEDEFLKSNFADLISVEYTSEMEKSLDDIAEGRLDYLKFLKGFFEHLEESAGKVASDNTNQICPNCGKPMAIRKGKYGCFLGCTGYPECKTIVSLKKKG